MGLPVQKCDCGAEIVFIRNTETKRAMPCEVKPVRVMLLTEGVLVQGYVPHWAQCPNRDAHRRKKQEEAAAAAATPCLQKP